MGKDVKEDKKKGGNEFVGEKREGKQQQVGGKDY